MPVIVSLTTIPSRIGKVHLVLKSILAQKHQPKKIILVLNEGMMDSIPKSLLELTDAGFVKILSSHLTGPHKKLLPALKEYPNLPIITCDDDFFYQKNWLENLFRAHKNSPKYIIANQTRLITYANQKLLPYQQWSMNFDASLVNKSILPIGAAGTLYPPKSLHDEVFDEKLFLKLSPHADDLWFKAMALKQGTLSVQAPLATKPPVPIFGSQVVSLKKQNIGQDKNRVQWQNLTDYYQLNLKND